MDASIFGLDAHMPGDWLEFVVLAVVLIAGAVLGARSVGAGFAAVNAGLGVLAFIIVGNVAIPAAITAACVAIAVAAARTGATTPRSGRAYAVEALLLLLGLLLYSVGRRLAVGDTAEANANTADVIAFERALGMFFEPDLQTLVLRSEFVTRSMNWAYSFAFLAIVGAILVWLWARDERNYRLLRDCMAISGLLAIPTMALLPVAPPRLYADSGMVDTIAMFGRDHAFVNEYAAIPSLHVGWMAVAGLALGRSIGGTRGRIIAVIAGPLMLVNVIATGNHFWLDGLIGAAYALGAAAVLVWLQAADRDVRGSISRGAGRVVGGASLTWTTLGDNRKALFSFLTLGGLLAYLLIAQRLTPGFTDYWGYLVGQVAVFLILLVVAEVVFAKEGGLSWFTHGIAVACAYADVLGTDGNLYAAIDEYDKLTHFAGVAAISAGFYDILRALYRRGDVKWQPTDRLMLSVAIAVAVGIAWEGYELIGDRVFNTARVGGRWDTGNDIVSDTLGAIVLATLLWWMETRSPEPASVAEHPMADVVEAPKV